MSTVFVASKLVGGFIMRGHDESIEIPGPLAHMNGGLFDPPPNKKKPLLSIAGFAITEVPVNIWNEWISGHWNSDMVLNKLVFAHASRDECVGLCWQNARVRSGFEQIRRG